MNLGITFLQGGGKMHKIFVYINFFCSIFCALYGGGYINNLRGSQTRVFSNFKMNTISTAAPFRAASTLPTTEIEVQNHKLNFSTFV